MKRFSLSSLGAGLVVASLFVACQDQPEPTSPPSVGTPQAAISDALHTRSTGNPHFFWLDPVVRGPKQRDFNGEFDHTAQPTVEVWLLSSDPDAGPPPDLVCVIDRFDPAEIDGFSDHFHVGWTPALGAEPDCGPLEDTDFVRVFVQFGRSDEIVLRYLGYRDYEIGGSGHQRDDTKGIGLTETEALKFRIEEKAGCFGDPNNPVGPGTYEFPGCAIGTLTEGTSSLIGNDYRNGLFVEAGTLKDGTKVIALVEKVTLGPGESCVSIGGVPVDLAQYPDCLKLTFSPPEIELFFEEDATLTFAFCPQHDGLMIDEVGQLPDARVLDQEDGEVFVLDYRLVPALNCLALSSLDSNPFTRFARGLLRRIVAPIAPQPLYASVAVRHYGVGGGGRSERIVVGMPASISDPDDNINVNLGDVAIGQPNPVSVLVRDVDGFPVMLSWVNFTPGSSGSNFNGSTGTTRLPTFGDPDNQLDPANGTAGGSWTLNETGTHTLTAGGLGYVAYPTRPIMGDDEGDGEISGIDRLSPTPVNVTFTANGVLIFLVEFGQFDKRGSVCDSNGTLGDVVVQVREADGTAVGDGIDVSLQAFNNNGTPAEIEPFDPALAETDEFGIATFTNLCITKPGAYRWRATASAPDYLDSTGESGKFSIRPKSS
jgi:hypothetical protein